VPDTADRADLIGFTLTHALFRNELPRLVEAFSVSRIGAPEQLVIEDHLRLVTDHLLRHHQEEDRFHWPALAERAPGAVPLLGLLEKEHEQMDPLMEAVRDQTSPRQQRAGHLQELSALVMAHLDEEDRSIVPLLAVHITEAEQSASMQHSRAAIPPADELRVLSMMLAAADEAEKTRMLTPLPSEVRQAWENEGAPALRRVHDVLAEAGRAVSHAG
jgi:hypothetical protein